MPNPKYDRKNAAEAHIVLAQFGGYAISWHGKCGIFQSNLRYLSVEDASALAQECGASKIIVDAAPVT